MPKIVIKRRGCLGRSFREVFKKCRDSDAIELLRLRYSLPPASDLQLCVPIRKKYRIWGGASIKDDYYTSLYQIIYLNVYQALQARRYNIGKDGIEEDQIAEYQLIQQVIVPYPWLSGSFKRY